MRVSLRSAIIALCLTFETQIEEIYGLTTTCCEWKGEWGASPIPLDKDDARLFSYLQGLERTSRENKMTKKQIIDQARNELIERLENPKYRNMVKNTRLASQIRPKENKEIELIIIMDEEKNKNKKTGEEERKKGRKTRERRRYNPNSS